MVDDPRDAEVVRPVESVPGRSGAPGPTRSAVVTGASRGLGAQLARRLAEQGWAVVVNYHSDADGAEAVVASITAAGGRAVAVRADVTDEQGVIDLVAAAQAVAPVGAIIANATGRQPETPVDGLTWRQHLDQLEFFVKSPSLLVAAALPGWREHGGGRVVLIGSDMADRAPAGWSAYVAAKNAQVGLVKVWAKELGPDQVTVNLVQPGWIPVERHAGADTTDYEAEVPLRRMGTPDDIAAAVGYLCSPAAGFVTGQVLTVNGGHVIA